jgi:hypothetical protein
MFDTIRLLRGLLLGYYVNTMAQLGYYTDTMWLLCLGIALLYFGYSFAIWV